MSAVEATSSPVLASWLTPRLTRSAPVHRWFVFPHSYGPPLVESLISRIGVEVGGTILDPFCGAGTTLVEAQRLGFHASGIDLLPLAVLVSRAKTRRPSHQDFSAAGRSAVRAARTKRSLPPPPVLDRAFDPSCYARLAAALATADESPAGDCVRVAVLSVSRRFSRLVADGGWLRRAEPELSGDLVPDVLAEAMRLMEGDLGSPALMPSRVEQRDARTLPLADGSVDAVITSPPYPNRHDYTRVFAVELELAFALGSRAKQLRYQAIHSHPEARPDRVPVPYDEPAGLSVEIAEVEALHRDARIPRMLRGYFRDMSDVLRELHRVTASGGGVALIVGNAQYCGVSVPVDEHLAEIGLRAGFELEAVDVLRIRGNSAQQMREFGRNASRESLVLLRRP